MALPQLIGLVLVVALVFGGLVFTGGHMAMEALPLELALIGGAAVGTLVIGNSPAVAKEAGAGVLKAFTGAKWTRDDYQSMLVLLGTLMRKARRGGFVSIEADIETPMESETFAAAPAIRDDVAARSLICDAFRLMALDLSDPARAEAHMNQSIHQNLNHRMKAVAALHTVADALPALGIVAAVLGIIRTMGSIDQSPAVLGAMIGTALLGTFLGVFLAYGVVGPLAARFGQVVEDEAVMLETARTTLAAFGSGIQPGICVELGRAAIPADLRPEAEALERAQQAARFTRRAA
ncbi:flagellar motor stator protein MotA [Hyphomonas sp.]|uniref:flagellar motor stator protein MotA n=2 Tax=Hyphomonas TaxID=85 RepID=UPI002354731C|nr:flagellar motor stator protein MotA [Hyphomonas sp.]|tara:strand:- start:594 stop:1472 length:879 start_codon:yes stop_codon:yes gene_type:complete